MGLRLFGLRANERAGESYVGDVGAGLQSLRNLNIRLVVPDEGAVSTFRSQVADQFPQLAGLDTRVATPKEIALELVCARARLLISYQHSTAIEADIAKGSVIFVATGGLDRDIFGGISEAREQYLVPLRRTEKGSRIDRLNPDNFGAFLTKGTLPSGEELNESERNILGYARALIDAIADRWQGQRWVGYGDPYGDGVDYHYDLASVGLKRHCDATFWTYLRAERPDMDPEEARHALFRGASSAAGMAALGVILTPYRDFPSDFYSHPFISIGLAIVLALPLSFGFMDGVKGVKRSIDWYLYKQKEAQRKRAIEELVADVNAAMAHVESEVAKIRQPAAPAGGTA